LPCDGVAVMQAQLDRQAKQDSIQMVTSILKGHTILSRKESARTVAMDVLLGGTFPIKIAISETGTITAITQSGTFAQGKDALEKLIVQALQAKGADLKNIRFEQHRHDHQAPRLAYNVSQARG